jgi:membrane protein YqaA with SNARE-associated domain
VNSTIRLIARALFRAGGLGLLTLGAFDSSPLVVPFGNDILVLALCARYHERMPYYAAMATLGSLIGVLFTDWLSRKGERKLKSVMSGRYVHTIQHLVDKRAGLTLVIASLLPPPFPFTPVVAAAAAFRYPRKKLLGWVALGRFARFVIEGALAIHYGRWIIRQARAPWLDHLVIALIVISLAGSAYAVYQRAEGGKRAARQPA